MIRGAALLGISLAFALGPLSAGADELGRDPVGTGVAPLPQVEAGPAEDWLFEEELGPDPGERDPWEGANRPVFAFNDGVYRWVLDPVAEFYQAAFPRFVRVSVRNFFANLHEPVIFTNEVLQGAGGDAMRTVGRFSVNSTVGIGGLFEPARRLGLEHRDTSFGETLAAYGVPPGSYLVLPLLGPSTGRDAIGEGVDLLLRPDTWLLGATPVFIVNASDGFSAYDMDRKRLDALRETSVDFYSAMRGAYLMDRDARVEARLIELGCESPID